MSKRTKEKGSALINVFSNNKLVLIISLVLAIIIWVTYSMTVAPEKTRTISDVPISISLTDTVPGQLGLKAYGYEEVTIDVEISGKSHLVGQVTADELVVSVKNINQIDDAGFKTIQLSVASADGSFTVKSISKPYIQVYFDFPETREFEVVHNVIEPEGGIADDGYYYGGAFYGAKTLSISGPKSELDKITEVVSETVVSTRLNKTTSMTAEISLRTSDDQPPQFISYDDSKVKEVSLSIQKTKLLKFMLEFDNVPEFYKNEPLNVKFSKQELLVAGTDSQISSFAYFEAGTVDFSQLSPSNNTFEFEVNAPNGISVIDDTERVTATVDMSGFAMEQFVLGAGNISVKNVPSGYTVTDIGFVGNVQIVAPKPVIASISSSHIVAEIDLTNVTLKSGANEVEITGGVKNRNECWAYGTYKTTITVS